MRLSKTFFKFSKSGRSSPGSAERFLRAGCFIQKYRNGRYYFLPLGMIVFHNVTRLLREYLWKIGAQETMLPLFHSNNLWKESKRKCLGDIFVTNLIDRGGSKYNLAASPEEMYLNLIRGYCLARNDLPINFFQFGKKFRDEYHTRGLLRLKEFTMMDSYSFHADKSSFQKEYEKISDIFIKFFDYLGLKVLKIKSDGGFAGGLSAYEFVLNSKSGESTYVTTKDHQYLAHTDVAVFKKENININEKKLPIEKVRIPDSVRTVEDYARYFSVPKARIIKSKAYKNLANNKIVIASIRGDLDLNEKKLSKVAGSANQIIEANTEDLESVGLSKSFLPAWGHSGIFSIGDDSLLTVHNLIGGKRTEKDVLINLNYERDFKCDLLSDIALVKTGYKSLEGKKLTTRVGIELGNIYQMGQYYTSKMKNAVFVDLDGRKKPLYMGAYSIGIERTIAAVVEKNHDDKGIIWPPLISPFDIYLIHCPKKNSPEKALVEKLYCELENNFRVLYDDRKAVGVAKKINDGLIIGLPFIVVIDKEILSNGNCTLIVRKNLLRTKLKIEEVGNHISGLLNKS